MKMRVAKQDIKVLVPSRNPVYPVMILKGEAVPDEVAELFKENGWCEASAGAKRAPEAQSNSAAAGGQPKRDDDSAVGTGQPKRDDNGMTLANTPALAPHAAAVPDAAAPAVDGPQSPAATLRAKTTRKVTISDGPHAGTYAKGLVIEGDVAAHLIDRGHAVEIKDGSSPEVK